VSARAAGAVEKDRHVKIFRSRGLADEDRRLARYVLGLLPDAEAERLDEQSIVDDEIATRLRSVEDDLVDGYVRGTLDGELLERFESWYLASPRRRDKVAFARQLLNAIDRPPTSAATATRPVASLPGLVSRRPPFIWLATAAVLLLVCGLLFLQDVRLRRGLLDARHDGVALDSRGRDLARELGEQRVASDTLKKEIERLRAARPLALVLRPATRAAAPVSVIAVPPGLDVVAFDLELEPSEFSQYEVALKDPVTNRIVWRSGVVTPVPSRRVPAVAVAVPANLLRPQHYSFELSGRAAGAAFTVVGSYAFQMEAR
jgi:hypothetical protein